MNRIWYQLEFGGDLTQEAVLHFMRSLTVRQRHGWLGVPDVVVLEISKSKGRLLWQLGVSEREHDQVLSNFRLALPDVRTHQLEPRDLPNVRAWELRTSSSRRPLRTDTSMEASSALLAAVGLARDSETIAMQWLVGPWLPRAIPPPAKTRQDDGLLDFGNPVLTSEQLRALRQKQLEPLFGVVGRIAVAAHTRARTEQLLRRVVGALQVVRAPGAGLERRLWPAWLVGHRYRSLWQPLINWPCVLNASELASCIGWPIGSPPLEGVSYSGHRQLAPSTEVVARRSSERVTGQATFPGREALLRQPLEVALSHTWCIGPTGVGKSTWLANMALQDIAAGHGVVVVDPSAKGDLVSDVVDRIPTHRLGDVVVLDPGEKRPVGLNVLDGDPETAADAVVHVIHDLYAAHWGPRTADVLHHALLTLARQPDMTLCELPPLLINTAFRRRLIATVRDDHLGVGPFWSWFEGLSESERPTVVGPVLNKLRQFTQRPAIRAVIGQHPGFDLSTVLSKRKVLLINLAAGTIGSESAQLLGALIVGQLWRAVQARGAVPASRRRPVMIYLDEFQQLLRLPLDLGDAMVQARGLGAGLVVAHQHLGQLTPAVRAAVLANARSRVIFQVNHDDAVVLAKQLGGGLTPADFQNLGRFETYQALHTGRGAIAPASAITLPLPPGLGSTAIVRSRSAAAHGRLREEVDTELLARRRGTDPDDDVPIGAKRRGGRS